MFSIKTLIEIFDNCQVENAIAGLKFKPEKIIYIGYKNVMATGKCAALKEFFIKKGVEAQISFEIVGRYDINSTIEKLEFILDNNEDCYIDITGGKELVLTAIGIIAQKRKVPVFQFNIRSERFISILNCDNFLEEYETSMTISEAVELNGCSVIKGEGGDYSWNFTKDFKEDIEKMWGICKKDCVGWNRQSNIFDMLENLGSVDYDLNLRAVYNNDKRKTPLFNKVIMDELVNSGLIYDYGVKGENVFIKYKNNQVREALKKAGNILELYSYIILKEIEEENPGYYDDIDLSIYIDWDKVHHTEYDKVKDTKNEVDVMVTKNLYPIFISCKNGEVHKEALYELETVADRFGGKYAKKILLATYVNNDENGYSYLKQRARDMNITVLDNIHKKTKEEIKKDFLKIIK